MAEQKKMVEAITPMEEDFAQWYTDIVKKAELMDYSSVRGCMVIEPYAAIIARDLKPTEEMLEARLAFLICSRQGLRRILSSGGYRIILHRIN